MSEKSLFDNLTVEILGLQSTGGDASTYFVSGMIVGAVIVVCGIYRSVIWNLIRSYIPSGNAATNDEEKAVEDELQGNYEDEMEDMDIEMLRHLHEDTKRVIDEMLGTYEDLSGKAIQLVQVNGLVITILIATAGVVTIQTFINPLTVFGTFLFLISAVIAGHAYRIKKFSIGFDVEDIRYAIDQDLSEHFYHLWLLQDFYPDILPEASTIVNNRGDWIERSILAFLLGAIFVFTGIVLSPYL